MQKNRYLIVIIMMIFAGLFVLEPVYAAGCNGLLTPGAYDNGRNILASNNRVADMLKPLLSFYGNPVKNRRNSDGT